MGNDAELRVRSTHLFGFQIDEAIIFRAKRPDSQPVGEQGAATDSRWLIARPPVSANALRGL